VNQSHGIEKLSHLEDKIYRAVELLKREGAERETVGREIEDLRSALQHLTDEKTDLESQIDRLVRERDAVKLKVEAMLDAIAVLDLESGETVKK
jgi:FtsZ-binding cell division protein ZapB